MILKQLIKYANAPCLEATWVDENDVVIRCHAYSNAQMAELRADLGADSAEHEALIAEIEATYVVPEPSPPVVPQSCTPAQGLFALFALKQITESSIQSAINSLSDPVQRYTAQIGFSRATEWRRDSSTTQMLASLMALSPADLDALFTYAVTVSV